MLMLFARKYLSADKCFKHFSAILKYANETRVNYKCIN